MKPKVKTLRAGPQDIIARQVRVNPADGWRWVETVSSIVRRTTVGAMPRPVQRSKPRQVKPAAIVYQRGTDSTGRPKHFQSLTNLVRRSVGLPR